MRRQVERWIPAGALLLLLGGAGYAQESETEVKSEAEAGSEEMAAMMAAGAPGEHHQHLAMLVGEWTYAAKMWMPGAPEPAETSGTMKAEPMLGGRFVQVTWSGEFMGQPFEGIGIEGYDNTKEQYTTTWRDNFGTYTLTYTGSCDGDGKVRQTTGTYTDPASGEQVTDRGVTTFREDGTVLMESWRVKPEGEDTKSMEIVLTRR